MNASQRAAAALTAGVLATCAACASEGRSAPSRGASSTSAQASAAGLSGTVIVDAAASLTGTFTELGSHFEAAHPGTTVKFSFGASSTLAQQILAGAPADVFASASPRNMTQVRAVVARPTNFASNTAEIATAPSAAGRISSLADLAKPGVTVALCEPTVPCGALAATVLAKAGVTVRPTTRGLDVTSTLAYVTSEQVDAAIVYATDVRAAGAKVVGVAIPTAQDATTSYPIAVVRASAHGALAAAFVAYVESAAGQSVLAAAGFSAP